MNTIQIRKIRTPKEHRMFLTFPWRIYRHDPIWVPPLLPEREKLIDPERGPFFQRGQAEFFIAWRGDQPVGTICAAEDRVMNQARRMKDCLFGFFECINDYQVTVAMLDHVKSWAKPHNLDYLYGPFNLDYEDSYGVLVEGRERPPALLCGHAPPYYQEFIESYGFQPARGDSLAFEISIRESPALVRLSRLAGRLRQRGRICIRGADLAHWDDEIDRVHFLLNEALAHLPDFAPWDRQALRAMLEPFRRLVDPELVLFAEVEGETVGWFSGIPNFNEILIHVNGLRYPWDYLRLAWYARRRPTGLAIKSVLVLPEYWDTGVSVLLFDEMAKRARAKGYQWTDLSLTSEDNPFTPALAERMGARLYKRYRVYRLEI